MTLSHRFLVRTFSNSLRNAVVLLRAGEFSICKPAFSIRNSEGSIRDTVGLLRKRKCLLRTAGFSLRVGKFSLRVSNFIDFTVPKQKIALPDRKLQSNE